MTSCKTNNDLIKNMGCSIEEKFYSKKNKVYKAKCNEGSLLEKDFVVVKRYLQSYSNIKKEVDLLKYLKQKGLSVPEIYFQKNEYLLMEYIEGKTLLDIMEEREQSNPLEMGGIYQSNDKLIGQLIEWMKKFYYYTDNKIIMKDINLRNFIVSNEGIIYGFDFEDYTEGDVKEDIGKLCAYMLTYSPPFTSWKLKFTQEVFNRFANEFGVNHNILLDEVEKQINRINSNRGQAFSTEKFKKLIIGQ